MVLTKVQRGLKKLEVHWSMIQASVTQVSMGQASVRNFSTTTKITYDIQVVQLLGVSLHFEIAEDR